MKLNTHEQDTVLQISNNRSASVIPTYRQVVLTEAVKVNNIQLQSRSGDSIITPTTAHI